MAIGGTQAKLWNFVFIGQDRVLAAHLDDKYVGFNQARLRLVVFLAGAGIEMLDDLQSIHDDI